MLSKYFFSLSIATYTGAVMGTLASMLGLLKGTFFCVMFWHLRANLILCIDVALHYLKPVVKSVVLMRSANFYNPVNDHFTLQS